MNAVVSLYATFPDATRAAEICRILILEGLVACANIGAPVRSLYIWQGALADEAETPVLLKTTVPMQQQAIDRLAALHPFETPCILVWADSGGHEPYRAWVAAAVKTG